MAGSVNKVVLIGNLTRDPEIRKTQGGVSVASFCVATNEKYTDRTGNRVESVEYHNIVAWNKLAEVVERYLRKGNSVYVEGKMKTRSWDENGSKRYRTEVLAELVQFIDKVELQPEPVHEGDVW